MKLYRKIFALSGLTLALASCSFADFYSAFSGDGKTPEGDPTIIVPTERGVNIVKTKYTYKTYIDNYAGNKSVSPSIGESHLLVIPVWFTDSSTYISDAKKESVRQDIQTAYFGTSSETGWESVSSYYKKDSFNKLTISGKVSTWYSCGKASSYYRDDDDYATRTSALVSSAVSWYKVSGQSTSLSEFDADKDGYLDGVMLIYGAPDYNAAGQSENNLWAYCYWTQTNKGSAANPDANAFFWASYDFMYSKTNALSRTGKSTYGSGITSNGSVIDAHTYIHEMGHVFGLDDYYDYTYQYSPAAGFSMQDNNVGGHDPFSRLALGWVEPFVPDKTCTFQVNTMESSGELVILSPNYIGSPFDEYIILELYSPQGLNQKDTLYKYGGYAQGVNDVGVRVWHVDARLYSVTGYIGNKPIGEVTNVIEQGSFYINATNNTSSGERAINYAGKKEYNINHLIRNNKKNPYNDASTLNASMLFKTGSSFSISDYSSQFTNGSKLNNKQSLGWTVSFDKVTTGSMTITCTKTA